MTTCMLTYVHLPCDMGVMVPGRLWCILAT